MHTDQHSAQRHSRNVQRSARCKRENIRRKRLGAMCRITEAEEEEERERGKTEGKRNGREDKQDQTFACGRVPAAVS
jgi:hypothetical protein